ncbi:MAG: DUF348 domain-containing protein [Ruminiclostridium sp.]|nr:DUF348 domain-containing protein [Ruminiclostridium sp.]
MITRIKNSKLTIMATKNTLLRLALICASVFAVFTMTGLLYFRNDVRITDGDKERIVYTVSEDPKAILRENHIALGAYDKIEFSGFGERGETAELIVKRAFAVEVYADGEKIADVYTVDSTVETLLKDFGVEFSQYDLVTPARNEMVKQGEKIEITRAYDVNITADGKVTTVGCYNNTVAELLERAGITLDKDDMVSEELDKVVTDSCDIKVSRVEIVEEHEEEIIPYETLKVPSIAMAIGDSEVRTKGVNGIVRKTTTTTYIDGVKVDVSKNTVVLQKKVDEVIAEGSSVVEPYCKIDDPSIVLENGRPVNYEYIVSGKATAYTAPMGAYTASGRLAEIGTCAVNPNVIPYGSKLYIVGQNDNVCYGYAIAADTGDGMMDGSIPVDLYMGNCEDHYYDSCAWGLQYVDIYVIEVGDNEYLW